MDAQEQYSWQSCLIINGMAKLEHEEGADNSDDVSQVVETLERECGISPDVIKNNLDKIKCTIGCPCHMVSNLELLSSQQTELLNSQQLF